VEFESAAGALTEAMKSIFLRADAIVMTKSGVAQKIIFTGISSPGILTSEKKGPSHLTIRPY